MNDITTITNIETIDTEAGAMQYLQQLSDFALKKDSETKWMNIPELFDLSKQAGVLVKNRPLGKARLSKLIRSMVNINVGTTLNLNGSVLNRCRKRRPNGGNVKVLYCFEKYRQPIDTL